MKLRQTIFSLLLALGIAVTLIPVQAQASNYGHRQYYGHNDGHRRHYKRHYNKYRHHRRHYRSHKRHYYGHKYRGHRRHYGNRLHFGGITLFF